jgi:menaquinone-dependent protoporphyrinogen IX oxidase
MAGELTTGPRDVLVVYYSLTGNTARVARDLARRTRADIESLRDGDHGTGAWGYVKAAIDALRGKSARLGPLAHTPRNYRLVLVGTPTWVGRITPAVRAYLERHAGDLTNVAFFSTSGGTDVARLVPELEKVAGRHAVSSVGFSAPELADPTAYEAKLGAFLRGLQLAPHSQSFDPNRAVHAR